MLDNVSEVGLLLDKLKLNIREEQFPCFTDEELVYVLEASSFDLDKASYNCLIRKAFDNSIRLPSGMDIPSNKEYWLSLARLYRQSGSRNMSRKDGAYEC